MMTYLSLITVECVYAGFLHESMVARAYDMNFGAER